MKTSIISVVLFLSLINNCPAQEQIILTRGENDNIIVPVFDKFLGTLNSVELQVTMLAGETTVNGTSPHNHGSRTIASTTIFDSPFGLSFEPFGWFANPATAGTAHTFESPHYMESGVDIGVFSGTTSTANQNTFHPHSVSVEYAGVYHNQSNDTYRVAATLSPNNQSVPHTHSYESITKVIPFSGSEVAPFLGDGDIEIFAGQIGTSSPSHLHTISSFSVESESQGAVDFPPSTTFPGLAHGHPFDPRFWVYAIYDYLPHPECFAEPTFVDFQVRPKDLVCADFNNDTHLDLVVIMENQQILALSNDGSGSFTVAEVLITTDINGTLPEQVLVADFNYDNSLDIAAIQGTDSTGLLSIFLNDGSGSFLGETTYSTPSYPRAISTGDFDGDMDIDLVVVGGNGSNGALDGYVSVLLNNGVGSFVPGDSLTTQSRFCSSVAVGDVDGDLSLDLAVACVDPGNVSIYLNSGVGAFTLDDSYNAAVLNLNNTVSLVDTNGNGFLDFAVEVIEGNSSLLIFENIGGGVFEFGQSITPGDMYFRASVSDMNRDNAPDIVFSHWPRGHVSVMLNDGVGGFQFGSSDPPQGFPAIELGSIVTGDLDGDGTKDVAMLRSLSHNVGVLLSECSDTIFGDVNLDGAVNLLDIDPFIDRIGTGTYQAEADCNDDGEVNLLDVDFFIAILGGG